MIQPFNLAVIDLGTNSVRLDIYRIDGLLGATRLFRLKEMIRLGEDVFRKGFIKSEVVARTLDSLQRIQRHLEEYNVSKHVAFGTCALRSSANAEEFLRIVKERTGIQLRVISGRVEAALIAKAVLNNERTPGGYFAMMDIGGGSTEVSLCYKRKLLDCFSFDLGSSRLTQKYRSVTDTADETAAAAQNAKAAPARRNKVLKCGFRERDLQQMRELIHTEVKRVRAERNWPAVRTVMGSSGTIRAIWKILRRAGTPVDPFKRQSVKRLLKKLTGLSPAELLSVPGMEERRVDIILPGTLLFDTMLQELGATDIFVTNCSLRDGILDWEIENLLADGHLRFQPPENIR